MVSDICCKAENSNMEKSEEEFAQGIMLHLKENKVVILWFNALTAAQNRKETFENTCSYTARELICLMIALTSRYSFVICQVVTFNMKSVKLPTTHTDFLIIQKG